MIFVISILCTSNNAICITHFPHLTHPRTITPSTFVTILTPKNTLSSHPKKFIWRAHSISKQQSQSHSQHLTFWSNYKSTHETSHSSIHSSSFIHDYPNETSLVSQQDNLTITLTNEISHSPNSFLPNDPLEELTQSLNNNHQNSSIHETYVPCSFHNQ